MKHVHAGIVKAKAENTDLCLLIKRTSEQWIQSQVMFPINDRAVSYYLCHPKHLEACLAWLNGNVIVVNGLKSEGSNGSPSWFSNTIFMDESCNIRVNKEYWALYDTVKKKLHSESVYSVKPKESGQLIAVKLDMPE